MFQRCLRCFRYLKGQHPESAQHSRFWLGLMIWDQHSIYWIKQSIKHLLISWNKIKGHANCDSMPMGGKRTSLLDSDIYHGALNATRSFEKQNWNLTAVGANIKQFSFPRTHRQTCTPHLSTYNNAFQIIRSKQCWHHNYSTFWLDIIMDRLALNPLKNSDCYGVGWGYNKKCTLQVWCSSCSNVTEGNMKQPTHMASPSQSKVSIFWRWWHVSHHPLQASSAVFWPGWHVSRHSYKQALLSSGQGDVSCHRLQASSAVIWP